MPATAASSRWLAERPGIDRDEFIDDIPFPETQNYVKRIIGTAEDYRVLYRDRRTFGSCEKLTVRSVMLHVPSAHVREGGALHRVRHPRDDAAREPARRRQSVAGVSRTFRRRTRSRSAACDAIRGDINQYAVTWGAKPLRDAIAADFARRYGAARRSAERRSPSAAARPKR